MINGNEYAWEDIQIILPGKIKPIDGVVAINYEKEKDHKEIYGRGADPVALGRGLNKHTGSITLNQSEVEALQSSLPRGKDLTDIPAFTISVSYAPEGGISTTDELKAVRFKKIPKGMKVGDGNMEVVLELAVGKINYNI